MRRFIGRVTPEAVGYQLAHEKEEISLRLEAIDREAEELFGISTIDEWVTQQAEVERKATQRVTKQREIREKVKTEIWDRIESDYREMRLGHGFGRRADQSWLARFKRELRTLDLSRAEALRMLRGEDRSPEVR